MKKKILTLVLAITCLFTMVAVFIGSTALPNSTNNIQSFIEASDNSINNYYESSDELTRSPLWGRVDQRPLKPSAINGAYL